MWKQQVFRLVQDSRQFENSLEWCGLLRQFAPVLLKEGMNQEREQDVIQQRLRPCVLKTALPEMSLVPS
jgi:hypothetical protein